MGQHGAIADDISKRLAAGRFDQLRSARITQHVAQADFPRTLLAAFALANLIAPRLHAA
jgi:hypothetical protein